MAERRPLPHLLEEVLHLLEIPEMLNDHISIRTKSTRGSRTIVATSVA